MKVTNKTRSTYTVICDILGSNANGRSTKVHDTYEGAVKEWETDFAGRNKDDGYDEYWRKTPLMILHTITSETLILHDPYEVAKQKPTQRIMTIDQSINLGYE